LLTPYNHPYIYSFGAYTIEHTSDIKLSAHERTCCIVISDIFLDIELQELHFNYMARELHCSPLTLEHVDALFWNDLYLVLIYNLLNVAGEWAGFMEEEICQWIEERRASEFSMAIECF
jgi:hypothetical protein